MNKLGIAFFIVGLGVACFTVFAKRSYSSKRNGIDFILIQKKERILTLFSGKKKIKTYQIALGFNPEGPKKEEGDGKTPEGSYFISSKNPKSQYHLSLKISYPSEKDKKYAAKKGVNPGGDIMIHGLGKKFRHLGKDHVKQDWTLGCVAVTDEEIEEIYDAVEINTPVTIQ